MSKEKIEERKVRKLPRRVRTPTVLQMEAVECGAAALAIIFAYYQRIIPLAELRRVCGVSRDGVKASKMVQAARYYGMNAKGFKKGIAALQELQPPFIIYWNFNHFLVVEGFGKERVYLNDPATGPRTVSDREFDRAYTGIVLIIEPGSEFEKGGRKPSLTLALVDRLRGSVGEILLVLFAGFLLVLPGLALPAFNQVFVDNILIEGRTDWLRPLIFGMVVTIILQGLLVLLRLRYLRQLQLKLSASLSSGFLWHILRLPVGFYAQRYAGEISYRMGLNNKIAGVLSGQLATTAIDSIMVIFYGAALFAYNNVLAAIGIFFAGINGLMLRWVSRQRKDIYARSIQERGKVAGVAISGIQSMETLKASALESDFFAKWSGHYAKAIDAQQSLGMTNQVLNLLPAFLTSLTSLIVLTLGGLQVMEGEMSIGMLIAFQSLMASFQRPINTLMLFGSTIQELDGDLDRLDDVLRNPIDPNLSDRPLSSPAPNAPPAPFQAERLVLSNAEVSRSPIPLRLQGYLEIQNLSFGYSPLDAPLIENFSLSLTPGQRVALVGGSGSGKSTIAKLVGGLYQPRSGQILFDGFSRSSLPASVLTNSIAMVEQEVFLFGGTVQDNLTLWDVTLPRGQIVQACKDALIHDVILALPGGYNGLLQEEAKNLSGGQRQRLEIARALVTDPSILIMDEATSALDSETEKAIDRNIRCRGCTCLIVAHRLSTIRDCDEIIVMQNGKIAERGTHEELWQTKGVYADLLHSGG
ncbi:MAG: NHLP family bacteriocin export ABC transporter peptidase/permease/ATPase subunit [Cyanobacteria bacterium SBLK]|nr:NHLP family bacteriocin export ABC transporter peptidase/permease/ATPase subunit [Cyanobacteria bacterium SBLK]